MTATRFEPITVVLTLLLAGSWACSPFEEPITEGLPDQAALACVDGFDPAVDYFPDKVEIRHAEYFSVSYHGHYKVVQISVPFGAVDVRVDSVSWDMASTDVMVLVRCGTPTPPLEGALAGAAVITTPAPSVAVNDDFLALGVRMSGALDRLVGVGGEGIYDTLVDARRRDGLAVPIGYSFHGPPRLEVLLRVEPGITLLHTSSAETAGSVQRVRDLGLAAAPAFNWAESTPLGGAEWLKYVAVFLGAEAEANRVFDTIEADYLALSERARAAARKPTVIWAQGGRSAWTAHVRSIGNRLLSDAGALNLLAEEGAAAAVGAGGPYEGEPFSLEALIEKGAEAEWWITYNLNDEGWPSRVYLDEIRAYREGRVYHHNLRRREADDAYDWFESGRLRPDILLRDFVSLFHPELLPDHELEHLAPIGR